jgi:ribosomal protein S18 acetylase RimI-like enzyme
MGLEFRKLRRSEILRAAELAARSFDGYEYFTNWFPEKESRNRFQRSVISHEYRTNYGRADYLMAAVDGKMAAVAQLNPPTYRKPSDLNYVLHGWLNVYKSGDRKVIDEWLAMDAAAGQPCHDYQKTGPGIWYASSLTVDPAFQGTGIGSKFLEYWEGYVREKGGREIVFFTNSRKNLDFYLKRGYEVFDEREIEYGGKTMGSWSLKKVL